MFSLFTFFFHSFFCYPEEKFLIVLVFINYSLARLWNVIWFVDEIHLKIKTTKQAKNAFNLGFLRKIFVEFLPLQKERNNFPNNYQLISFATCHGNWLGDGENIYSKIFRNFSCNLNSLHLILSTASLSSLHHCIIMSWDGRRKMKFYEETKTLLKLKRRKKIELEIWT